MEDEREKNKSEPEVIEVNNLEEEDSDNKGEMDGMLQTLNHQIERENQAANAKAKAKRKKGVKEEKKRERKDSGKPSSANDVEDDMEKQLAEKLRQKIADSLDKVTFGLSWLVVISHLPRAYRAKWGISIHLLSGHASYKPV